MDITREEILAIAKRSDVMITVAVVLGVAGCVLALWRLNQVQPKAFGVRRLLQERDAAKERLHQLRYEAAQLLAEIEEQLTD
jgi:hypothetical protein